MLLNWEEFLRETAIFFLLDRANENKTGSRTPRVGDSRSELEKKVTEPPSSAPNFAVKPSVQQRRSRSQLPSTPFLPNIFYDESFRKHAKILGKLKQHDQEEDLRRKQYGSLLDYSIVESLDEEDDEKLPKLKCYRRDDRNVIVDPWTAVKDIQRLRTQPIGIKTSSSFSS